MRISLPMTVLAVLMVLVVAGSAQAQWTWTPQTGRLINKKRLPMETPELQIEHARSLMVEGDYQKALRETEKFQEFYDDTEWADDNQFLRGEIRLAQGEYLDAAREFQQLIAGYPETDLYDDAIANQYEAGDALYEQGRQRLEKKWTLFRKRPLRRAADVYAMVIDNQPFTAAAAEAQYKIGLVQYTLDNYRDAAYEYRRVIEDYSGSDWVDEAMYGLAQAYYHMSLPPAYDQTPSEMAIDAIDSYLARFPQAEEQAELAGMRAEMVESIAEHRLETARFYEKRRNFDSAQIYYRIVANEYPDTSAGAAAQAWLAEHDHLVPLEEQLQSGMTI